MTTIAALLLTVATVFATPACAGHSPLDGTFSGDGAALTPFEIISGITVQPDGRVLAVGSVLNLGINDFAVVRFESDGSLDTTFDGDGLATGPAFSGVAQDVVVQADGKIVLLGDGADFTLVRFEANGAIDAMFGSGGVAFVDVAPNDDSRSLAIQADGKLVGVGQADDELVLFRLDTTGAPDPTFDGDGIVTVNLGVLPEDGCLALAPDGKIVVGAQAGLDAAVLRYDTNGSLDPTFDGDGIALLGLADNTFTEQVAVQADGRILLAARSGSADPGLRDMLLARFNTSGTLDPTFDGDGIASTRVRDSAPMAVEVLPQPDGRVVVVGRTGRLTVLRYDVDGRLDPTLDGDGVFYTDLVDEVGAVGIGIARGAVLDAAGRIVVTAWAAGSDDNEQYVLRFDVPPVCDPMPRLDCETGWLAGELRSLESAPGRERLVVRLASGPALSQSDFGDPVAPGGTAYRLCFYDDADRLVRSVDLDRPGEFCEGTACWKTIPAGYSYRDRQRRADGTQGMLLRGGSTRSLIKLIGRNRHPQNQWDLPTGISERLLGSTNVTVQVVPSDTGGCFSKQLTQILVASPTKFRAK